jgi:hypothetical protein
MPRRLLCAAVFFAAVGVTIAAEPIKLDLKDFKCKAKSETAATLVGYNDAEGKIFFYTFGTATAEVKVPDDGEYTITIEASCDEAQNEKAKFKLTVGDEVVAKDFLLKETSAKEYPFTAKLKKGTTKLVIEFLNDVYKENEYDRNLYVHAVKLEAKK